LRKSCQQLLYRLFARAGNTGFVITSISAAAAQSPLRGFSGDQQCRPPVLPLPRALDQGNTIQLPQPKITRVSRSTLPALYSRRLIRRLVANVPHNPIHAQVSMDFLVDQIVLEMTTRPGQQWLVSKSPGGCRPALCPIRDRHLDQKREPLPGVDTRPEGIQASGSIAGRSQSQPHALLTAASRIIQWVKFIENTLLLPVLKAAAIVTLSSRSRCSTRATSTRTQSRRMPARHYSESCGINRSNKQMDHYYRTVVRAVQLDPELPAARRCTQAGDAPGAARMQN